MTDTDYSDAMQAIKQAVDEFRANSSEPAPINVRISAFLDFDDYGGRDRSISVSLNSEQCQTFYNLVDTDISEAVDFLFGLYVRPPMEIRNAKVKIDRAE